MESLPRPTKLASPRCPSPDLDVELSDEQVVALLDQARCRLAEAAAASVDEDKLPTRLPSLDSGSLAGSALRTHGSVTTVDPKLLVEPADVALAAKVKKVEDPVAAKKKKAEVRSASPVPKLQNVAEDDSTPIT